MVRVQIQNEHREKKKSDSIGNIQHTTVVHHFQK